MDPSQDANDRSDPAARALARRKSLRARDQRTRVGAAAALGALAVAMPLTAAPLTGSPGASVGAVVGALLALAVAVAIWPAEWSPEELEHRRLDSIWCEVRSDADQSVPWERYAAWAEPIEGTVVLGLLHRLPISDRVADAPSPYRWEVTRRLDADDIAAAAEAMEALRDEASELELTAEQSWRQAQTGAERRAHEQRLADIDREAQADAQARDAALRREMDAQEAADRRAQAEGVASALRRG